MAIDKNRNMAPSERSALQEAQTQQQKDAAQEAADSLKRAMNITFNSHDGMIVLQWLRKECGHNEPILAAVGGQIDEKATLYQAMRLNLYLKMRKMLNKEIIMEVEL